MLLSTLMAVAAWLFALNLAWVSFAATLNFALLRLNLSPRRDGMRLRRF